MCREERMEFPSETLILVVNCPIMSAEMSLYGVDVAKRVYHPNDATGGDEDQLD